MLREVSGGILVAERVLMYELDGQNDGWDAGRCANGDTVSTFPGSTSMVNRLFFCLSGTNRQTSRDHTKGYLSWCSSHSSPIQLSLNSGTYEDMSTPREYTHFLPDKLRSLRFTEQPGPWSSTPRPAVYIHELCRSVGLPSDRAAFMRKRQVMRGSSSVRILLCMRS